MLAKQTICNWERFSKFCLLLITLSLITSPIVHASYVSAQEQTSDLQGVRVALYVGDGVLGSSALALEFMFLWMNATVDFVTETQILNGSLNNFDILVMPGGSAFEYSNHLGIEGFEIVREFVGNGGSYFGICGGSFFATNSFLGLFEGSYSNPINGTGIYLIQVNVNHTSSGPDLSNEPDSYLTMYWASAYFYSSDMSDIIPITTYAYNDKPGMIALMYGDGTVFLSSSHPEYEEDSTRDGTNDYDYLNDPDSEWNLLLKVSHWLIDASKSENNNDESSGDLLQPILYSSIIISGIVALIVYLRKRI